MKPNYIKLAQDRLKLLDGPDLVLYIVYLHLFSLQEIYDFGWEREYVTFLISKYNYSMLK